MVIDGKHVVGKYFTELQVVEIQCCQPGVSSALCANGENVNHRDTVAKVWVGGIFRVRNQREYGGLSEYSAAKNVMPSEVKSLACNSHYLPAIGLLQHAIYFARHDV